MNETETSSFSIVRTLMVAVPVAVISVAATLAWNSSLQQTADDQLNRTVLTTMLGPGPKQIESDFEFVDADGDLLADPPADGSRIEPDSLVFSYIAEELDEGESANFEPWREVIDALAEATGKPVEPRHFESVVEQLAALREGEVHLVGLGTGAAPLAVKSSGFVPLCTLADAEGEVGYKMVVLAAKDGGVNSIADVRGRRVIFVRPTSNSGFKAGLLHFYDEAGLLPEQDYEWSFSLSHADSVMAVVEGRADVATVASDILARMIEQGQVSEGDYKVVYESEAFPPAVIGCAHNLQQGLIDSFEKTLTEFDWAGTGLESTLGKTGAATFVPVDYKDNWAIVRRIDSSVQRVIDGL